MNLLEADKLFSGYGSMEVLHGVSLHIKSDEIVTIIGPNGAGKSTLFKTMMGYLKPTKGRVFFREEDITHLDPNNRVELGIAYVPQLNNVFPSLTVQENLEMGGYLESSEEVRKGLNDAFNLFPVLKERKAQKASTLSGGESQMLAMARALMTGPDLLFLDEPSAGLAPKVSTEVFHKISDIHASGMAIAIVEQDAYQSLNISNRGYVLAMGKNQFTDDADKILNNEEIKKTYLGG